MLTENSCAESINLIRRKTKIKDKKSSHELLHHIESLKRRKCSFLVSFGSNLGKDWGSDRPNEAM